MTYNELVSSAMRTLGLVQAGESPTADEYAIGIQALNEMLSGWRAKSVNLDWTDIAAVDGGNTTPFDPEDVGSIRACLAEAIAPEFGKTLKPQQQRAAYSGFSLMYAKYSTARGMQVDAVLQPAMWPGRMFGVRTTSIVDG